MSKSKSTWYVPHPTYRYEQDVKALAKEHGLIIVDPAVTDSHEGAAKNPPELTLKPEYAEEGADKKLTVAELREALTTKGIEFPADAKKADLQTLLNEAK